jgi:thiosulfate dehydrogenase
MATRRSSSRSSRSGGSFMPFLFGVVFTLAVVLTGGWAYLHYGHPPAAFKKSAAALESSVSPAAPIKPKPAPEIQQPPFGISEDVFESGARVYTAHCASCHGVPGRDALVRPSTAVAPQLWRPLPHSLGIGVSNLSPGETYSRIENGVHPPAMPAYRQALTTTQIWQVSLLLKNANQPLPDPVQKILREER